MELSELSKALAQIDNQNTRDLLGMQLHIKADEIPGLLKEFELWTKSTEDYKRQSFSELNRHFLSWVRKRGSTSNNSININKAYGITTKQQELDEWERECQERVIAILTSGGFTTE